MYTGSLTVFSHVSSFITHHCLKVISLDSFQHRTYSQHRGESEEPLAAWVQLPIQTNGHVFLTSSAKKRA